VAKTNLKTAWSCCAVSLSCTAERIGTCARRRGGGTNDEWGRVDRTQVSDSLCLIVRCEIW